MQYRHNYSEPFIYLQITIYDLCPYSLRASPLESKLERIALIQLDPEQLQYINIGKFTSSANGKVSKAYLPKRNC